MVVRNIPRLKSISEFFAALLLIAVFCAGQIAHAERIETASSESAPFLTLHVKEKVRKKSVRVKGRAGIGSTVSIFVNGVDQGEIPLRAESRYSKKVPLAVGENTIRVMASRDGTERSIQENVEREATKAIDKPLWITILHSKNQTKKRTMQVKGEAHGVFSVSIAVDGIFQKTATVKTRVGKFKARVTLEGEGAHEIQATAEKNGVFVTATKRIIRQ